MRQVEDVIFAIKDFLHSRCADMSRFAITSARPLREGIPQLRADLFGLSLELLDDVWVLGRDIGGLADAELGYCYL